MHNTLFFEPLVGFEPTTPASLLYRAATTKYPCCVPTLGDSEGAGRTGLAHVSKALQNQCKPSAESLLYAEAQPDFARGFSKTACKGTTIN